MQDFLEYVVKGLVDRPEEVTVTPVESNGSTVYELRLNPSDVGKVIGRSGATIQAVRHLLQTGAAKSGMRCSMTIVEDDD